MGGEFAAVTSGSPAVAARNVTYSLDQIADYLTDGYWDYKNESPRTFNLDASRSLSVDISRLAPETQTIATRALEVWSEATGITFVQTTGKAALVTESTDAGATTATATKISANSIVTGSIATNGDNDFYQVSLTAGRTYLISMNSVEGSNVNSVLRLLDKNGRQLVLRDADKTVDGAEFISYTAPASGTYYIAASDNGNNSTGGYRLSVQQSAAITFSEIDNDARAWTERSAGSTNRAYINVAEDWGKLHLNGYMLQTYIHEIGHALGLGHAGPYNGRAIYNVDNGYANDSWANSVMSYFDQRENTQDSTSYANIANLMPADLIAVHNLYGAGSKGNQSGDTVWGPGGNHSSQSFQAILDMWGRLTELDRSLYVRNPFSFTVYDTAGNDTLDFSAFSQKQNISLVELERSDVAGLTGNVVIARGTVIENAIGGKGHDTITGNAADNNLSGKAGNDSLFGGKGDDTLNGGEGADLLDGGEGFDFASYTEAKAGVQALLYAAAHNKGEAAGDTYKHIEGLLGSDFADILAGDQFDNAIFGGKGNDQIDGLAGDDRLYGGQGNDVLAGSAGNDSLYGGEGNDLLYGGAGADHYDGGEGVDVVSYVTATAGLRADLAHAWSNSGAAAGDSYKDIETLQGSYHADILVGDDLANTLAGLNGNDTIDGRGGNDTLAGGEGDDLLIGGGGNDVLYGGAGADTFLFHSGYDVIMDFEDDIDQIHLHSMALGAAKSVADVLGTAIELDGIGIRLMLSPGAILDIRGVFDVAALQNDIFLV